MNRTDLASASLAVIAGVVAVFSPGSPTVVGWWNGCLKFLLAALVVMAASRAPRWIPLLFAGIAAGASGSGLWAVSAWAGLVVALAALLMSKPGGALLARIAGVASVGLAVQAILRMPSFGFFGLPTVVAAAACAVVLIAGYAGTGRVGKSIVNLVSSLVVVAVVAVGMAGMIALLGVRADVERGIGAAQRGLAATRAGDIANVERELALAESTLNDAERSANGWLARGLRFVPVAAHQQSAIGVAAEQGATIASRAAAAVRDANLDSIRLRSGQVDLGALAAMSPRLTEAANALKTGAVAVGETRSGWLLPTVSQRVDQLLDEVEDFLPQAQRAADASAVLPRMLGGEGSRSYFVMFGTPAESREGGGLLGSWARIVMANGTIELADSGRINELYDIARASSVPDSLAPGFYLDMARPVQYPQNLPSSADFVTVAAVAQAVLGGAFADSVDGFIYLDTHALIDLMELTGPVTLASIEETLTAETAPAFLFEGQYRVDETRTEIFDSFEEAAEAVLSQLATAVELPGPEELGRILGPAARGGRLQMATFDDAENEFLRSVKLLRTFGDTAEEQDFVGMIQSNGTPSKLDLYLQRELDYDINIGTDGTLGGSARMTLTSRIPADAPAYTLGAPEWERINRTLLSLYTNQSVTNVRIDDATVQVQQTSEYGLARYLVTADVMPTGVPLVVEFDVAGRVDPDEPYSLKLWHQPLVNDDQVKVFYRGPNGAFEWRGALTEDLVLDSEVLAS